MKVLKFYFGVSLIAVCMGFFNGCFATLVSARCRSRCFAQFTTSNAPCTSQSCLACLKPCNERKTHVLSCSLTCGLYNLTNVTKRICEDSCEFLNCTHLEDGNLTCPEGVSNSTCVLMTPESLQVAAPARKKMLENYTISWNGTWPSSTVVVFVVMAKQWKKGSSTDANTVWTELKQTSLTSVQVYLQPLFWYRFKVAAANQYDASSFSRPSRLIFARPRPPLPPREFDVTTMQTVKGKVQVHVVWKKPVSSFGLPVNKYRLSWSVRLDKPLGKYVAIPVTDKHLLANTTEYTITELLPNATYILELKAVARWKRHRLRSKRVTISIRTPVVLEDKVHVRKKPPIKKEKFNGIFKKPSKTLSTSAEVDLTKHTTSPTDVLTSSNEGVTADIKKQKSTGGVNRVSWFMLNTLTILASVVPFSLR